MTYTPSDELLKAVRARFVMRGTSLARFCREMGIHRQNASQALTGKWTGKKATALVERIVRESGLTHK